jgi:hypothetical protein
MLKTFKIALGAFIISLLAGASLAMAQTTVNAPDAATVIPAEVQAVYQLNTEAANPVGPLMDFAIKSMTIGTTSDAGTEEDTQKIIELIDKIMAKNVFTFALDTSTLSDSNEPAFYITFKISEADFTALIDLSSNTTKTETYKTYNIYGETGGYVANVKGLLVLSNNLDTLKKSIDTYEAPAKALSSDANYMDAVKHAASGSFFNMYIQPGAIMNNPQIAADMAPLAEILKMDAMKMIKMEYLSVTQNSEGFILNAYVSGDMATLEANDLFFDKYNFTPTLYKTVTGQNLMFYSEGIKLNTQLKDLLKIFNVPADAWTEFNTWKSEFKTSTGYDLDNDIMPLLNNENAMFIHKTSQIFPALTVIFKTNNIAKNREVTTRLIEYLKTELDKAQTEARTTLYDFEAPTVNGTTFNTFNIKLDTDGSSGLPAGSKVLSLGIAADSNGYLIITTHPDPASIIGKSTNGILDNADVSSMFKNPEEVTTGVMFFSTDVLASWIEDMMTRLEAPADLITDVQTFLAPWHDSFSKTSATKTTSTGTVTMHVDTAKFDTYPALFEKMAGYFTTAQTELQRLPMFPAKDFSDITGREWFSESIDALVMRGVLQGYEDGTFRPNAQITRAEFITMLMKATGKAMAINGQMKPFNDVPAYPGEWFSENVIMAKELGLVDGYNDNTFKPGNPISRAEAMQIIFNFSDQLKAIQVIDQPLESLIHFSDVSKGDWFFTPVVAGVHYGIIDGTTPTTFEPNRNLTRAEAAKMIFNFLQNEFPETWGMGA